MEINILSTNNGVGLEKDANRLINLLTENGHRCHFVDIGKNQSPKSADINIFCEIYNRPNFTRMAKRNYLLPNPEWFQLNWLRTLDRMNAILCKTHDAARIFKSYHRNPIYTGFTSDDMLFTGIDKQKTFFHAAGKSMFKGTKEVIEAWGKNDFPMLNLLQHMNPKQVTKGNLQYHYRRFNENEFKIMMNANQFHICTSYYEGWGHYIHEAKSTGAIVITTNGTPMNEFINSEFGYICPASFTSKKDLATMSHVSIGGITDAVIKCSRLSDSRISEMSQKSRQSYLDGEKQFKETFLNIIND